MIIGIALPISNGHPLAHPLINDYSNSSPNKYLLGELIE
jgi:hypothetical protein